MNAYQRLTEALERTGCRRQGRNAWTCPAHDDRRASLSVSPATDRALVHCHAGCPPDQVLGALGLSFADLFEDSGTRRNAIVATYPYTDEGGRLLFEVVRFWPKEFRQRRPDGDGWVWNLNGVRRVPYRLPQLLQATREGRNIYVTEGERDVHAIERAGGVATTIPGGADKWRDEFAAYFAGADVTVVADDDEAGRRHAHRVAAALRAVAQEVRVVAPAVGKDAADHLAAGHSLEDFRSGAEGAAVDHSPRSEGGSATGSATPPDGLEVVTAFRVRPTKARWLWKDRVPTGAVTGVAGLPGIGKSTLTTELTARASRGQLEGDLRGVPSFVLIATAEDHRESVVVPRLLAAGADLDRVGFLEIRRGGFAEGLTLPDDTDALGRAVEAHRARMVIIDPLLAHIPMSVDSHKDHHVRNVLAPLARLAEDTDAAVVAVLHVGKGSAADPLLRVMVSIGITAAARSVLIAARDPQGPDGPARVLVQVKSNYGPEAVSLRYRLESREIEHDGRTIPTSGLTWLGEAPEVGRHDILGAEDREGRTERDEAAEWLRDYLAGGPKLPREVIKAADKAGHKEITLRRAKSELGVRSVRVGFKPEAGWRWALPDDARGAKVVRLRDEDGHSPPGDHLGGGEGASSQVTAQDGHLEAETPKSEHLGPPPAEMGARGPQDDHVSESGPTPAPGVGEGDSRSLDVWRQTAGFPGVIQRLRALLDEDPARTPHDLQALTGYAFETVRAALWRIREEGG